MTVTIYSTGKDRYPIAVRLDRVEMIRRSGDGSAVLHMFSGEVVNTTDTYEEILGFWDRDLNPGQLDQTPKADDYTGETPHGG